MNANELADEAEMWGRDLLALNMKGGIPVIECAKLVRQQQAEISLLREYISDLEKGLDSSINLNKAQAERQVKELTDEEIYEFTHRMIICSGQNPNAADINIFGLTKIVEDILRKAQEK